MTDYYLLAWYLDISKAPYLYGLTYWHLSEVVTNIKRKEVKLLNELLLAESGTIEINDLEQFVRATLNRTDFNQKSMIVFDDVSEIKILGECFDDREIEYVERQSTISEQLMKYRLLLNKGRFIVPSQYLFKPNLLEDNVSLQNILDPDYQPDQEVFPITQSFLVAGHFIDRFYDALILYPGSFSTNSY